MSKSLNAQLKPTLPHTARDFDAILGERPDDDSAPLLFQPEVLLLAERIDNAKQGLREAWVNHLDARWLEQVADAFGEPYLT